MTRDSRWSATVSVRVTLWTISCCSAVDLPTGTNQDRARVFDPWTNVLEQAAPLDPNWFYSTLAQSTAALVGLTGGFLVSRLLDRQRDVEEARPEIVRQYRVVVDSFERQAMHAAHVVASLEQVSALISTQEDRGWTTFDPVDRDRQRKRELKLMSTDERFWDSASNTIGKGTQEDVAALRTLIPQAADYRDAFARWGEVALADALRRKREIEPPQGSEWLGEEPDYSVEKNDPRSYWGTVRYEAQRTWMQSQWKAEIGLYESVRPAYERFRAQLVPRRVYLLIGILGGLIFAGVFVPLFFLSARDDAWREILIAGFGVLASALVVYLLFEVRGLRSASDLTRPWP
jgi:hypothetical protein